MKSSGQQTSLRVALVSPSAVRGELVSRIEACGSEIELVGYADTESAAVRLYFQSEPDVMVLDACLVPDEPARLIGMLKRIAPNALLVSLVPSFDSMQALAVRTVGADRIATVSDLDETLRALA